MNNINKILLTLLFLVVGTFFISCKGNNSSSEFTSSSISTNFPSSVINSSSSSIIGSSTESVSSSSSSNSSTSSISSNSSSSESSTTSSSSLNESSSSSSSITVEPELEVLIFTMDDLEVTYDGNEYYLEINEELPQGVEVNYINNNKSKPGTYLVKAMFIDTTGKYEIEDIEARLIIKKKEILRSSLEINNMFTYDGTSKYYEVKGLPEGVNVNITNNGLIKDGTYNVHVSFTDETGNYMVPEDYDDIYVICDGVDVDIPEGITTIQANAFKENINLESITLPSTLISVGEDAFYNCYNLKSVYFNGSLNQWLKIEFKNEYAHPIFYEGNLYFKNENGEWFQPTEITLEGNITSFGNLAFLGFDKLENTYFNGTLAQWLNIELKGEVSTPMIYASNLYFKNENDEWYQPTNIVIPEGITKIKAGTFYNWVNLESVILPTSLIEIGDVSFSHCSNLKSIHIPEGVTSIGDGAFYFCKKLVDVTLPNTLNSIGESAFNNCINLENIILPNGITCIEKFTFAYCHNMRNVVLSQNLNNIEYYAFGYCSSLSNIVVPNNVINIGEMVFIGCTGLLNVEISEGVINIGDYTFAGCSRLRSVILPNTLKSIGNGAFSGCYVLNTIFNNSNLIIDNSEDNGCVGYYATNIYNKGECESVDGVPTPLI